MDGQRLRGTEDDENHLKPHAQLRPLWSRLFRLGLHLPGVRL